MSETEEIGRRKRREFSSRGDSLYRVLDKFTEFLIYAILIFTPWAFGTTEHWAIETVNTLNFVVGGILIVKLVLRTVGAAQPLRWKPERSCRGSSLWIAVPLFALTVVLLAICATAAWNARAKFLPNEQRFEFYEGTIGWLPQSYDKSASWSAFMLYLAAACFFWSLRDWLLTKTSNDIKSEKTKSVGAFVGAVQKDGSPLGFPSRLKRLCWVIVVNAGVLAFEGTIQRLSGTGDLLWMVQPTLNDTAVAQFGPFNYRSNGAQYLNLIWPVGLAFWWSLQQHRRGKFGAGAEFLLLPLIGLILAGPIVASSRGGIAITFVQTFFAIGILAYGYRRAFWKIAVAALTLVVIVAASVWLQGDVIVGRFNENTLNTMSGRTEIYKNARKIVAEFPVWGTGPGSFPAVYQMYREDPGQLWYAQAHNDYLQTLVTFGYAGLTLLLIMLLLVAAYWFMAQGIRTSLVFTLFLLIANSGCLVHARFDFPFQIYSILLVFLTNCAILTVVSRR